jgi:protein SCO1/2
MPSDRRAVITTGAAALSGLAFGVGAEPLFGADPGAAEECARPGRQCPNAGYFPDAVVTAHDGRRARFYDDLLAGRTVMIHCMSIAGDAEYPVVDNLVRVQRLLGERVGRELFMYSLSVDPADSPRALADFAAERGVGPGWLFLTAEPGVVESLRYHLFDHGLGHVHPGRGAGEAPPRDCSLGLVRYGNEAIGLWGAVPAKADPEWIARRLSWVIPRERPEGAPRRRGPTPTTYRT